MSSFVVGYSLLFAILYFQNIDYNKDYSLAYITFGFLTGYIVNACGSIFEPFYYFLIGGKPSVNLLKPSYCTSKSSHSLFKKFNFEIKLYEQHKIRELLLKDVEEKNPSEDLLFAKAMRAVIGNEKSRIHDFNASYALSRTILTATICLVSVYLFHNHSDWSDFSSILLLLIILYRYRQYGYYFAREVLTQYLRQEEVKK